MMKSFLTLVSLVTLFCGHAVAEPKPNVLFILADDQGSVDLGCYGANDLHTPHLDALATSGVRFTQFYSAPPVPQ